MTLYNEGDLQEKIYSQQGNPLKEAALYKPGAGETLKAAFRQENTVWSALTYGLSNSAESEYNPDFDPFEHISGYEDYAEAFTDANTLDDINKIKSQIDKELQDKEILASAGVLGTVSSVAAGLLDPINLIPVGGTAYKSYKVGKLGKSVLSSTAKTAFVGGVGNAVAEIPLQMMQEARMAEESMMSIGGGVVLGGILGAAAGSIGHIRAVKAQSMADLEKSLYKFNDEVETLDYSTVGAKQVRETTLADEKLVSAGGLEKVISFQDPVLRTANSPSLQTRLVSESLVDQNLLKMKNKKGVATDVSVESLMKIDNARLYQAFKATNDLFVKYRTGGKAGAGARFSIGVRDLFRQNGAKLNRAAFLQEVGKAMRRGDQHYIPEVAEAAREYRRVIFEPMKNEAVRLGLLPEGVDVKTAQSYLTRVYDREKIIQNRGDFEKIVRDYMVSEAQKAALAQENKDIYKYFGLDDSGKDTGNYSTPNRENVNSSYQGQIAKNDIKLTGKEFGEYTDSNDLRRKAYKYFQDNLQGQYVQHPALGKIKFIRRGIDKLKSTSADIDKLKLVPKIKEIIETSQFLRSETPKKPHGNIVKFHYLSNSVNLEGKNIDVFITIAEDNEGNFFYNINKNKNQPSPDNAVQMRSGEGLADKSAININISPNRVNVKPLDAQTLGELDLAAKDVVNNILGQADDGRINYGGVPVTRGPLKERVFDIPDVLIEDYLENNIEDVAKIYLRTLSPDLALTAKFGSADMRGAIRAIDDDYNKLMDKVVELRNQGKISTQEYNKRMKKLAKDRKSDVGDVEAMRDRLRGMYNVPDNPDSFFYRSGRLLRTWNYITRLGGMTVSAITDIGGIVFTHGFTRCLKDGLMPLVKSFNTYRLAAEEVKMSGTALDMVLDSRGLALSDVFYQYGRGSKLERGTRYMSDRMSLASLMAPWNASLKQFAGIVTQARVLKACEAWANGKIRSKEMANLAKLGIDEVTAIRINEQFKKYGENSSGVYLARMDRWDDAELSTIYKAAMNKEVDRIIVTPGQDKPLFMSKDWGAIFMQFKSFGIAAAQRVMLAGLQRHDAEALQGAITMVGLGMLVHYLKTPKDRMSDNPADWVVNGLDRSGLFGWFFDINNTMEKLSSGRFGLSRFTGEQAGRYQSRNIAGTLGGPTVGTVEDMVRVMAKFGGEDWTEADTRAFRRQIPFQNLFYMRWLFDEMEKGVNNYFGIPMKEK